VTYEHVLFVVREAEQGVRDMTLPQQGVSVDAISRAIATAVFEHIVRPEDRERGGAA
jgi:hypothetical protein